MLLTRVVILVGVVVMSITNAYSQARAQADVQVRSVAVTEADDRLTCRVEVFSVNDAHDTKVLILFPVGVTFVSASPVCTSCRSR